DDATVLHPVQGEQQALGREERHLRVVGEGAAAAVGAVEVSDALRAVTGADLGEGRKLDGRAERVADGAAEEAAAKAGGKERGGRRGSAVHTNSRRGFDRMPARYYLPLLRPDAACPIYRAHGLFSSRFLSLPLHTVVICLRSLPMRYAACTPFSTQATASP